MESHLPHAITQCYLPPTQVNAPDLNRRQTDWYSTYLPRADERLRWCTCLQRVTHPSTNHDWDQQGKYSHTM